MGLQSTLEPGRTPVQQRGEVVSDVEDAIVRAYLRGDSFPEIQERFEVGRLTVINVLKRHGAIPARMKAKLDDDSKDAMIVALRELVGHLERELTRTNALLEAERRAGRSRRRAEAG